MLTVSGISSPAKIVKFFNREQITTAHNHKRRYLFTMFVNSAQKNWCSRFVRQGTENSAKHDDVRDRRGNIILCIARDEWRCISLYGTITGGAYKQQFMVWSNKLDPNCRNIIIKNAEIKFDHGTRKLSGTPNLVPRALFPGFGASR